ncbi:MAG: PilZ domain-containing protein [Candidatus Parcubacteria bacterium]|nr:PilZ domain-containing protein [Candidatus Parcubacteria bacterium]
MVSEEKDRSDSGNLPADKRQAPRKVVPASERFFVFLGQPEGSFKLPREINRKIPTEALNARLLAAQNANCTIVDISEIGLRICSSVNLVQDQHVGVFFQIFLGIPKEEKGITLICKVIWHKPWAAVKGMGHLTGLEIIHNSDSASYEQFVASLPVSAQAHA